MWIQLKKNEGDSDMCGIAGYVGTSEIAPNRLEECLRRMGRRGPDHAAWKHWKADGNREVYFLHSRLSIIDLDPRANQPFVRGPHCIITNGELYNYLEIRRDMEARGEKFGTTSDTEVLLAALAVNGSAALDQFEGMWAFAVFDENDGSLTLCRDRFGEKPLWIHRDNTGIYFGSEIKFISALTGRTPRVRRDQVFRYLVNGYKSLYKKNGGFFEDFVELPPASILRIDKEGGETLDRYWNPRCRPDDALSYADAVEGVRRRLIRSVELRLRADVPLAFCMSGGVDSNSLISVAKRVLNRDVHGFTIANTDSRYEEQDLVDHAVRELGLRHTSIPIRSEGFLEDLRVLVRQHDAPVFTITYFAHWRLMESIAKDGYRISVSGTAADELFSGYFDHHLAYLYEVRRDPSRHANAKEEWRKEVQPYVRNPFLKDPDLFLRDPGFRDHIFLDADQFSLFLKKPWRETFQEEQYSGDLLRNRMLNELFHENVPVILHEDDLNAMYFSIENRSPFLDRDLFEFAFQIPTCHLVRAGRAKALLRDAMRGLVPDRIRTNPRKVGFNAPVYDFLNVSDVTVRQTLLGESPIYDFVRKEKIADLIAKPDLPNSESKFLFYFVSAKMFLEEFDR